MPHNVALLRYTQQGFSRIEADFQASALVTSVTYGSCQLPSQFLQGRGGILLDSVQIGTPLVRGVPLLCVSDLTVQYAANASHDPALRQIKLEINNGEIVGILGESGCGKSTLALAILGLLPKGTRVDGSINFRSEDLTALSETALRKIRGAKISLIHQEPGISLSPVMRVGKQISEVLRAHTKFSDSDRKEQIQAVLSEIGLCDFDRIYNAYPHQLSGGELHRIAIAQALVCGPELLIADEATRSLDVALQLEILHLLREINQKRGSALVFITHDPMLLAGFADRCLAMCAGEVVEDGRINEVLRSQRRMCTRAQRTSATEPCHAVQEA
jgi:ABC-type glutathione transport system ATPase component